MTPHRFDLKVYYEDTDLAGIVYYANYLKFIERGRTEALEAAGIDQMALKADHGLVFVVRRVEIDYLAPARFGEVLTVITGTTRIRGASVEMEQQVQRRAHVLISAMVTIACMNAAGKPQRLPEAVREKLQPN